MTTATKFKSVTLDAPEYAIKMTRQMFEQIFGCEPQDIRVDTFELEWRPSWYSLRLPAIRRHWKNEGYGNKVVAVTFYGNRSLYRLKEEGYHLAGRCKVKRKEVEGYTSHVMLDVDGRLYSVEVISIRSEE